MMRLILAFALTVLPLSAHAASPIPNDCWSGVMAPDGAPHGEFVARGPVAQWRVGMSLVLYPTKEDFGTLNALADKGQTATFDTSRTIIIVPTWLSGPEPGDKSSGGDKNIQITMKYRSADGGTGTIMLTFWTPMQGHLTTLPPDQQATMALMDQQMHDMSCRGVP